MRKHRIFIAIPIPENVQRALLDETRAWHELPIRWTKPQNIHVTLLFIGNVGDEELDRLSAALPVAAEGIEPFTVTFNHIGVSPNDRMPRMVWAEGETSSALTVLQRRVEEVVSERNQHRGIFDEDSAGEIGEAETKNHKNQKPFRLHVTLGRMIPFKWQRLFQKPKIEKDIELSFPVRSIELMESHLAPEGPTHKTIIPVQL